MRFLLAVLLALAPVTDAFAKFRSGGFRSSPMRSYSGVRIPRITGVPSSRPFKPSGASKSAAPILRQQSKPRWQYYSKPPVAPIHQSPSTVSSWLPWWLLFWSTTNSNANDKPAPETKVEESKGSPK